MWSGSAARDSGVARHWLASALADVDSDNGGDGSDYVRE